MKPKFYAGIWGLWDVNPIGMIAINILPYIFVKSTKFVKNLSAQNESDFLSKPDLRIN